MSNKLIVVIDDEADLLELIRYNFEQEGYQVMTAENGESGLALVQSLAAKTPPACILLDLMLPGMDGMSVCRKLKAKELTQSIPVVMLTAKGSESDIVAGLELGADDYVSKPFSTKILVARVRSAIRRQEDRADQEQQAPLSRPSEDSQENQTQLVVGLIKMDLARHQVWAANHEVELSATEFMILEFLARNPGWVFSRARIIDGIRGKDYPVTERSVDVQVLGLRKKLGPAGGQLQTIRGVGYRLQDSV